MKRMCRTVVLMSLPILLAIVISGCIRRPADILIADEASKIEEVDGKVVINLVTEDYPPYGFIENGELTGIAVELVKELFKRVDVPVEINLLPWTRALKMAELGEADGIFTTFFSAERAEYLQYVKEPLAFEAQYIYYRASDKLDLGDSITSLSKYKIGIVQDYFLGDVFEKAKAEGVLRVEENTDLETNIQKLLDGKIDIMIDHHYSTMYRLKRLGLLEKIKESPKPFRNPESLHLCFSRKGKVEADLIERIQEALVDMKKDGTYQSIVDSYVK